MKESTSIEERNATFNGSPKKTFMKESIAALSASFLDSLRRHEQNLSTANGSTSDELVIDRSISIFGVRGDKRIVFVLPPGFKRKGFGRLYNQIVREIAVKEGNSVDDNARLFALVNAAMGDAGILAWDQKYIHDFWRPVLGIREHDASMGPAAATPQDNIDNDCDPDWLPLGAPSSNSHVVATDTSPARSERNFTPPFPAYPSGHATFGAAALFN
jgi:hypothetical protein